MTDTANLRLPFIEASQAQKHVTHNEALRILDAAIQIAVQDITRTAPPPDPADGDRHVVAAGATGGWAGQAQTIATWQDGAWAFLEPRPGWCIWSLADQAIKVFDGGQWRDAGTTLDNVPSLGVNTTADSSNRLAVRTNAALLAAIAGADGGSGDIRLQLSKDSAARTASVFFSDNYSGRAEFGLVGSDAFRLKVSADGSNWVEAIAIEQGSGNVALPRGLALAGVVAPPPIAANQNDYAPAGLAAAAVLQVAADAARSISGLAGGAEGRVVCIINVGSQPVTLLDDSSASSSANRFALGGNLALGGRQAAMLRYDGTAARWYALASPAASPAAGGSATARQNALLIGIYLAKALGFARRGVLEFCDGYRAADGILAASSSNYTLNAAGGYVAPTAAEILVSGAAGSNFGNLTSGGGLAAAFDGAIGGSIAAAASKFTAGAGYVGKTEARRIAKAVVHSTGAGWDSSPGTVGTYTLRLYGKVGAAPTGPTDGTLLAQNATVGDVNGLNSVTLISNDSATVFDHRWIYILGSLDPAVYGLAIGEVEFYTPGAQNMTLVTAPQPADATVSSLRALIEFDNAAAPELNIDLTVEVSCDGGANWTAAALTAVTSFSQSGRKVAETVDQPCAAGTSFAARVKTLNNKSVPIHGVSLTAR